MLLQSFCTLVLLTRSASAASTKLSSAEKLEKYSALARKNGGMITLNSESYDELTDGPRDFSISVLLTAMAPQYQCAPCAAFAPEHAAVAKQWSQSSNPQMHLFAILDFENGGSIFKRFGLTSAPKIQLYKPNEGPRASRTVGPEDGARGGFTAEGFSSHLAQALELPFVFSRPIDKVKLLMSSLSFITLSVVVIFAWPLVQGILGNKYLWATASVITILLMTSGYMWNQIRSPRYSDIQNGVPSYIAGGYSNQLGAETHIMAVLYGLLAFSAYTLSHTVPKLNDPLRQRLGVYVWTGISVVLLGLLTSIFTMKQGGYPFRFLF